MIRRSRAAELERAEEARREELAERALRREASREQKRLIAEAEKTLLVNEIRATRAHCIELGRIVGALEHRIDVLSAELAGMKRGKAAA